MPRPSHIILSKLGFAAHKQPRPPIGDDPAVVEQLIHDVLRAVGSLERKLHALEEHSTHAAPVSARYVQRLTYEVAMHTLSWQEKWPAADRIEESEPWGE